MANAFLLKPLVPASITMAGSVARTNYALYSRAFDNAVWTKQNATVTADATTSYDGATKADKLTASTTNAQHQAFQTIASGGLPAGAVCLSLYAKAGSYSIITLLLRNPDTSGLQAVTADLSAGTVAISSGSTSNFGITAIGGGQYRVWVSAVLTGGAQFLVFVGPIAGYTGGSNDYLFADAVQVETGTAPTTFIETTSAAVTTPGGVPDVGVATNLLNDYAGVIAQATCGIGTNNQAQITVDFGSDTSIDTLLVFGVELFPSGGQLIIDYATAAQGAFTGSYATDTSGVPYAGSAAMTSGKGVSWWMLNTPVTARYVRISYQAGSGVIDAAVRLSRLVIGKRIQPGRNFSYGAGFGVKDLGSLDFSRRGVLQRARGAKMRTVSLTFSSLYKDEAEGTMRPLLEQVGTTEMVAMCTDPAVHAQRQNRCSFGAFVGDVIVKWSNAATWEAGLNQVSIF